MQLASFYQSGQLGLSFELFPPKTKAGEETLFRHLNSLIEFRPSFITCTYGAGGSTRDKTLDIVQRVKDTLHVPVAAHLTCVGSTTDQLRDYLAEAQRREIDFIVALRGDPPTGEKEFQTVPGGLRHANELVALIRAEFPRFSIAVGGYPETHQEAPSPETDLENLKRKVDSGADIVITQLFYSNPDYFRFRDRCERIGIQVPVVPGILPITNLSQVQRITSLCRAQMPPSLVTELARSENPEWQFWVGVEYAARQVQELIEHGVPGLHFYVLNKSQAAATVLRSVGRRPQSN
jgi:methylenetetrahydrofolate reductase (NADPH)